MHSVSFNKFSEEENHAGGTTPNDESYWNESAISKNAYLFDDEDIKSKTSLVEDHFSALKTSSSSENRISNSTSASGIQFFRPTGADQRHANFQAQGTKLTSNSNNQALQPASSVVSSIIRGRPYILELYKGKQQKLNLLDKAIESGDGNAITATVLHMKNSMKPSISNRELVKRPVAVSHFINFLRNNSEFESLYDFYVMLGEIENAAMLKLQLALSEESPYQRITELEKCLKSHFWDPCVKFYSDMILDQVSLLRKQLAIQESDEKQMHGVAAAPTSTVSEKNLPRLIGEPVITSLYYCTLYHYQENENSYSNPISLKKSYNLTDKQYTWPVIAALAQSKNWSSIENLLTVKTLLRGSKLKCCIGFVNVAKLLHHAGAPLDIIVKYLNQVDPIEERLEVAKQLMCHNFVTDIYVLLKDAQGLSSYKSQLKQGTHEYSYLENALRASTIKWRN